jgi:uncharacterized repeat protein (TIGR01451 family)
MHRVYNLIHSAFVSLAVAGLVFLPQSKVHGQTNSNVHNIPQSVMEPVRVADNSANPVQTTRKTVPDSSDSQGSKRAPLVKEKTGPAVPFQIQIAEPPVPEMSEPFSAQTKQELEPPVTDHNTATYVQPNPVKPVSIQKAAPSISTQIEVPSYINLNQTAKMRIRLQNNGDVAATSVKLMATIPDHAKFVSSNPSPTNQKGRIYEFQVSDIGAKQTREVTIDLIPTEKKAIEIGTEIVIENVQRFTVGVREPKIKLALKGPTEANLGQTVAHRVLLENVGDGRAEKIELLAIFPEQLRCDKKHQVVIPALEPGQKLEIEMPSIATGAGRSELAVSVQAVGVESQSVKSEIQVYQPELEIAATGPKINFLNREGIYAITLDNTGSVDATNVSVNLSVPSGMKVTTISQEAKVNTATGELTWVFDRIAAKSSQTIKLLTLATMQGQQDSVVTIRSKQTKEKTIYLSTNVVTRPELSVTLQNQSGPTQVGGKVQFLVVVENTGSSSAVDLKLAIELPKALSADQQDGIDVMSVGNNLSFEAAKLEPGQKREFRFVAVASEKGEHVIRALLNTASSERQLTSEGVVFVYEINENRVSESLTPAIVR